MTPSPSHTNKNELRNRILLYVTAISLTLIAAITYLYLKHYSGHELYREADRSGSLIQKFKYYKKHHEDYDLIFVGDSRTYCNIQPYFVDQSFGSKSYNLAIFAHWFPTQYPFIRDLLESGTAKNKTVIWSIAVSNFIHAKGYPIVQNSYPLKIKDIATYWSIGFPISELFNNTLYYHFLPIHYALEYTRSKSAKIDLSLQKELFSKPLDNNKGNLKPNESHIPKLPFTDKIQQEVFNNHITSYTTLSTAGSYYRIELDHEFFRKKQREYSSQKLSTNNNNSNSLAEIDTQIYLYNLFIKILDEFKSHNINLIVNVVEEAPHVYGSKSDLAAHRNFMNNKIRKEVESRGFRFIGVNYDLFKDADYFDYNHMNSVGSTKYSVALGKILRQEARKISSSNKGK